MPSQKEVIRIYQMHRKTTSFRSGKTLQSKSPSFLNRLYEISEKNKNLHKIIFQNSTKYKQKHQLFELLGLLLKQLNPIEPNQGHTKYDALKKIQDFISNTPDLIESKHDEILGLIAAVCHQHQEKNLFRFFYSPSSNQLLLSYCRKKYYTTSRAYIE